MSARPSPPVRPEIRALAGYSLSETPTGVLAKLDFNESPYDVPDEIKRKVLAALEKRRWSLYPEFGSRRLKEAVARAIGRTPGEIVVGNGSGEIIQAAISVFAGGGELVLAPPTFSLYRQIAAIAAARPVEIPRGGDDFTLDEAAFFAAASRPGRVVPLLCSPNNPTGGTVSLDFVRKLCAAAAVVLLDQAYVEFAAPGEDAMPLLASCPNLVIFRTLSKAYSAAGFRIGYAICAPELAREIEKAILPFSVDHAAEELAVTLLEDPGRSRRAVAAIAVERERVASALRGLGARVAPSRSNFLFFAPPGGNGVRVRAALLSRGVLVRDMTRVAPDRLRVSIGSPAENDLFLAKLKESL
jgi:histidinol-phosphate aminotransferase